VLERHAKAALVKIKNLNYSQAMGREELFEELQAREP
jgi:hypothetical protein